MDDMNFFDQLVSMDISAQVTHIVDDRLGTKQRLAALSQLAVILSDVVLYKRDELKNTICEIILLLVGTRILHDYYRIEAAKTLESCGDPTYLEQAWSHLAATNQRQNVRLIAAENLDRLKRPDLARDVLRDLVTDRFASIIRIKAARRLGMMGDDIDGEKVYEVAINTLNEISKKSDTPYIRLQIAEGYEELNQSLQAEEIFTQLVVRGSDEYVIRRAINNLEKVGYRNGEPLKEIALNTGIKITTRTFATDKLSQLAKRDNRDDIKDLAIEAWMTIGGLITTPPETRLVAVTNLCELSKNRPNNQTIRDFVRKILWDIGCDKANSNALRLKSARTLQEIGFLDEAYTIDLYVNSSLGKIGDVLKDTGKIVTGYKLEE